MTIVSAPAKIHLIGEHSVVYGYPAIIAAVDRRIYVDAKKSNKVILEDVRWNSRYEWTVTECREAAEKAQDMWKECAEQKDFSKLLEWTKDSGNYTTYKKAMIGIALKMSGASGGIALHITKCDIPTGSGIGSSGAVAVAVAKAVAEAYSINVGMEKINDIAFECEKLIHGTPSGGDNSTSCYGGLIWFQKAEPKNIVKTLMGKKLKNFILVHTKQPEKTTGELVQMVRNIPESLREPKMKEIGQMTEEMKYVINKENYTRMKVIINRTNEILSSFGLSIPQCDKIYNAVKSIGGAAKMCGACGGGMMLCWHEDVELLKNTIRNIGFEPIEADIGVEGVRLEK